MRTEEPRAIQLKNYSAPDFRIPELSLTFALDPDVTRVTATAHFVRTRAGAPLVLNGEHMKLLSVRLDGKPLPTSRYASDEESLTIADVPDQFSLEIVTETAPSQNTALEGLYTSKGIFC